MAWQSSVPGVIDALVVVLARAMTQDADLAGVVVRDGPQPGQESAGQVLAVGWSGGTSDTDAVAQLAPEGLSLTPDREQTVVRCAAAVLDGTGDMGAARRLAYRMLATGGAAIDADHTLGSLVLRAMVGAHSLTQQQTGSGAQAIVVFEVAVDAYTGR